MLQLLGRFTNSFGQGWGEGAKKGTKSPHRASPDNRRRRFKGLMDIGMACRSQPDQFLPPAANSVSTGSAALRFPMRRLPLGDHTARVDYYDSISICLASPASRSIPTYPRTHTRDISSWEVVSFPARNQAAVAFGTYT